MTKSNNKPLKSLLLILIIGLALGFVAKMIGGWYLSKGFLSRGNSYSKLVALATHLAEDGAFSIEKGIPSIEYEPAYPALIALAFLIFGKSYFGLLLIQALLHTATSLLLFLIGAKVQNERVGLLAAALHTVYPFLVMHVFSVIDTTLFIFLTSMAIWLTLRSLENSGKNVFDLVALGIVVGIGMLTRGSFIIFVPPIMIAMVLITIRNYGAGTLARIGLCGVAFALIVGPWLARNYRMTESVLISTHGPFGVWQGNNEHALGLLRSDISLDEVYKLDPPPEIYRRYPLAARQPKAAIEAADAYKQEALQFIKENKLEFLELAVWKTIKLWTPIYNPVSKGFKYGSGTSRKIVYFVSYLPILLTAIVGVFVLWKRNTQSALFFIGIIFLFTLAHAIAMGYSRLRLPIDPILMIFSGCCIDFVWGKIQNKNMHLGDKQRDATSHDSHSSD